MTTLPGQGNAWIAFGFKSGMSRLDVTRHLADHESFVVTDGDRQTRAGPENNKTKYKLIYCSRPQKLYLMQFSLDDSIEAFVKTKEKFEKRYGEPTSLNSRPESWDSETWDSVDISFIWDINEYETVLLTHGSNGTSAEFQDLSICG